MSIVPGSVSRSTTQKLSETPSILDYGAARNGTTSATAAIQKALDKTVPGGTLLIPKGKYLIDYPGTGTECLLCPKPIHLVCETGAQILVAASVPSTVDVLRLTSPIGGPGLDYRVNGLYMLPVSGTPARYGVNIDTAAAPTFKSIFQSLRIEKFGTASLAMIYPSETGDSFFTSQFRGCYFGGGVLCNRAGDSITFWECTFYGDCLGVDLNIVQGAHLVGFYQCNSTAAKGFLLLRRGDNVRIRDCNLEGISSTTGTAEPAVIHILGSAERPCMNIQISGNCITTLAIKRSIKVDWGQDVYIENNWTNMGLEPTTDADKKIWMTPNAVRTRLGRHIYLNPVGFFDQYNYLDESTSTIYDTWDAEGDAKDLIPVAFRVFDKRAPVFSHGPQLLLQGTNSSGYIDLVIGTPNTTCTSAGHPFSAANVGQSMAVVAGSGFIGQTVKIVSVAGAVATCSQPLGPTGSSGGVATATGRVSYAGIAGYLRNGTPGAEVGDLAMNVMQGGSVVQAGRFTAEGGLITGYTAAGLGIFTAPTPIGAGAVPTVASLVGVLAAGANSASGIALAATLTTVPTVLFVYRIEPGGFEIWTSPSTGAGPSKHFSVDGLGVATIFGQAIPAGATVSALQFQAAYGSSTSGQSIDLCINTNPAARIVCRAPGSIEFWTTSNSTTTPPTPIIMIDTVGIKIWSGSAWVALSGSLPSVGTPGAQLPLVTTDAQGRVISSAALTTASAVATSSLSLTGVTAMTDVPGASVSLVAGVWLVNAVFAFSSQGGFAAGGLNVGGTLQAGQAQMFSQTTIGQENVTAAQCWIITVVGTQTVKLQASLSAGTGSCLLTNTTINCVKVG